MYNDADIGFNMLVGAGHKRQDKHIAAELGPALTPGQRGCIVTDEKSIIAGHLIGKVNTPSVQDLSAALVLFECIDWPKNFNFALEYDEFICAANLGVARRSVVDPPFSELTEVIQRTHVAAFAELSAREPGRWALFRSAATMGFMPDELTEQDAFSIKLRDCLPIFDRSVPIEDVQAFKEKHQAELIALREHLDSLVHEMAKEGFPPFETLRSFERFDRSLADYSKLMKRSNLSKIRVNLDIKFKWDHLIAATLAQVGSLSANLPLSTAIHSALVGGLGSIALSSALSPKSASPKSPFDYLYEVERHLW